MIRQLSTSGGHSELTVMQFGLTNTTFQHLMECVLATLSPTQCLLYLEFETYQMSLHSVAGAVCGSSHFWRWRCSGSIEGRGSNVLSSVYRHERATGIAGSNELLLSLSIEGLHPLHSPCTNWPGRMWGVSIGPYSANRLLAQNNCWLNHPFLSTCNLTFPLWSTWVSDQAIGRFLSLVQHGKECTIAYWSR